MTDRLLARVAAAALVLLSAVTAASPRPEALALSDSPKGAPNVVVVLLDDVGFGAASTFGGPADTPTLEALANEGLRYNRFHTTAICSPTRASLLTGRDAHAANVGAVLNSANAYPGYQGILKKETATVARVLQQNGYATGAFGKWHLAPVWETTPAGPFDRWPTGLGFDTFYGFLGGETDQFEPTLYRDTHPIMRPATADYHFTEDMTDQAIRWMQQQKALRPERPFFMYYATGAAHAPLQVPTPWIERYRGRFAEGWDALRQTIFERQKQRGVIPSDAKLTPRPQQLPAWDSLSTNEQAVAQRFMETYAGFLAHTDAQIGRLVKALKDRGEFDNTLFIYVVGDNGSSSEGGLGGSINYMGALQGLGEPLQTQLEKIDHIGGPDSYPQFNAGWAWALTAPFQWVKQVASHLGGSRNPLVISWPSELGEGGGLRSQFSHVNDLTPTILDAVGISMPSTVDGVAQKPLDGKSLLPSLRDAGAAEHKHTQLFEVHGHVALYHKGWMLSARHDRLPWTVGLPRRASEPHALNWELYHLDKDFSQANDLAAQRPDKVKALEKVFRREAERLGIYPIRSSLEHPTPMPSLLGDASAVTYPGGVRAIPETAAPRMSNRSWQLQAALQQGGEPAAARGVLATLGGTAGGWSLYLDDGGRPVFHYKVFELSELTLRSARPLSAGEHTLSVEFDYDGEGYGKGGRFTLRIDGKVVDTGRVPASPPAFFSIDETFDTTIDTGSPAGRYPADAALGYPLSGAHLHSVTLRLR